MMKRLCFSSANDQIEQLPNVPLLNNEVTAAPVSFRPDESENEEGDNAEIRGSDDDEQEDPKDYCKGGYHPVAIGSLFNQRYHVIRKLGWGKTTIFFSLKNNYHRSIRSFFNGLALLGSERCTICCDESRQKCETLHGNSFG